jgi:hypothetical protein
VRRVGLLASVVVLVMALGPVTASADGWSYPRYGAQIKAHGLGGRVVVILADDRASGSLKWSLEGLRPDRELVITVKGGTCGRPGALIVRHWQPVAGSTSTGKVVLPEGSAAAFAKRADSFQGSAIAMVRSGQRHDCSRFVGFGGYSG